MAMEEIWGGVAGKGPTSSQGTVPENKDSLTRHTLAGSTRHQETWPAGGSITEISEDKGPKQTQSLFLASHMPVAWATAVGT